MSSFLIPPLQFLLMKVDSHPSLSSFSSFSPSFYSLCFSLSLVTSVDRLWMWSIEGCVGSTRRSKDMNKYPFFISFLFLLPSPHIHFSSLLFFSSFWLRKIGMWCGDVELLSKKRATNYTTLPLYLCLPPFFFSSSSPPPLLFLFSHLIVI